MLRLYDTRHRRLEPIEPARRGELRVFSCGPAACRHAHIGSLRAYLLPDLIRRAAGRHRLTVISGQSITDEGPLADDGEKHQDASLADRAALNIYPADYAAMSLHYFGDVIDIHTGGVEERCPHRRDERAPSDSIAGHEVVRHWVHGEHLLFDGRKMARSAGNVVLPADVARRGLDPLAVRLALLEHRYRQQMNLTWDTLAAADAALRRWRDLVAEWANSASKPMCAQYTADFAEAVDDDLDTPRALRVLRDLEQDGEIPPGSKFETFAAADALLGLDLARDVGRPA